MHTAQWPFNSVLLHLWGLLSGSNFLRVLILQFFPQSAKNVPAKTILAKIFSLKMYSTDEIKHTNMTSRILLLPWATQKHKAVSLVSLHAVI